MGCQVGKFSIHVSAEWYDKVDKYALMDPEPFYRQSDGELIDVVVIDDLNSVINYGIGLDWKLKENLLLYGSFATDFSAVKSDTTNFLETEDVTNNAATKADIFHFATGSSFVVKRIEIILGLGYAFGNQSMRRPINLPDGDNDPIFDDEAVSRLSFSRWKFILGFSVPLQSSEKAVAK